MDIHLVTAFKGGSGKTLISLALLANLGTAAAKLGTAARDKVLAVDLNSTNPNFYEILSSPGKLEEERPLKIDGWRASRASSRNPKFDLVIACPENKFQLLGSAENVWSSLAALFELGRSERVSHVVIDTDFNMANLAEDKAGQIGSVFRGEDRLFLWNIWMPHYLVDEEIHVQHIMRTEEFFKGIIGSRFLLVHVINDYLFSRNPAIKLNVLEEFARRIGLIAIHEDRAADLLGLSKTTPVSSEKLFRDLREDGSMPPEAYVVEVLSRVYHEGGLPCNIVPIGVQKGLENYVRDFQRSITIAVISDSIAGIQRDVDSALEGISQMEKTHEAK